MKIRALLTILIGLSLPSPGQEPDQDKDPLQVDPARDLYDLATLNYNDARKEKDPGKRERDYRIAAKKFDQFLRTFPRDEKAIEAWYFLGMTYRQIGEDEASRTCFKTAASTWKTGKFVEASALFLASDDYKDGKWRDAAKWFQIVADTTKNEEIKHQSLYRRFLCFHKLEDKGGMLLSSKAVLANEGSPYAEKARLALARLYRDSKSTRQAHEQFVILSKSRDAKIRAEAVFQAAVTAQALGDKSLTKTWFRKTLSEAQAKDVKGKTQLALMNLHYKDKQWQDVIEVFRIGNFELDKNAELQRLIMAAKSYDALDQKNEVTKLYQQIAKLSPGSASSFDAAYNVLVRDHEKDARGFAQSAEAFLTSYAIEKAKDPKIHSIRLLLAEHYYSAKSYEKAISHYRLLDLSLVDASNTLGVRYHVAKSQLALKNEKGALAAIAAFITQFPEAKQCNQLRLDRAELLNAAGREAEAVGDYEAILLSTTDQKLKRILILRLAAIYQEQESWEKFAAMQNKLLLLPGIDQKTEASANFWLGWNELRLKNSAKAEPYLRIARTLAPKTFASKVSPILIKNAFKAGNLDLLEKEINLARKDSPKTELSSSILQWLGATLIKKGEDQRGWPFLDEGLADKTAPAKPLVWKLYTQASLNLDKPADALRGAGNILKLEENAYRKAEALYLKSQAHTGLKQFDEARQAASDALDLRPAGDLDIRLRMFAGDIDIAAGKPDAAIRHYIVVESTYAKTAADKKEALAKVISTLKAIGTPKALELLKDYQK
ncbi:MAG: tetratricopeptide repeat protein [Akkermansiaceae bacterium]|nr:tetratricopeptide repeat protein [Akkermansiaceae bacterium]